MLARISDSNSHSGNNSNEIIIIIIVVIIMIRVIDNHTERENTVQKVNSLRQ